MEEVEVPDVPLGRALVDRAGRGAGNDGGNLASSASFAFLSSNPWQKFSGRVPMEPLDVENPLRGEEPLRDVIWREVR